MAGGSSIATSSPKTFAATEQRQFKILDLGLAREFNRQEDWRFAGTPAYASPEQAAELPSDGRTDQYALGSSSSSS